MSIGPSLETEEENPSCWFLMGKSKPSRNANIHFNRLPISIGFVSPHSSPKTTPHAKEQNKQSLRLAKFLNFFNLFIRNVTEMLKTAGQNHAHSRP